MLPPLWRGRDGCLPEAIGGHDIPVVDADGESKRRARRDSKAMHPDLR